MRSKILGCMRALTICSVLVCCAVLLAVLYWVFAGQMDAQMDSYANLLSRNMNLTGMTDELLQGVMDSAAVDVRVTLIAPDGVVRYDSHADSNAMENHLAREEVQQALLTGAGESSRVSDTLDVQTIYQARLLDDGSVLRISRDRQSVFGLASELFTFFGLVFILTSIVSSVIATRATNSIVRPINEINLLHPENNQVYEELTPLLLRMEQQNRKLDSYMRELEARRTEFETITNNMTEGLLVLNSRRELLSLNRAAVQIFAPESVVQDWVGHNLAQFSHAQAVNAAVEQALDGSKVSEVTELNGRYHRIIGNPVRRGDSVTGVVVLVMDVNDVYLNERSRREFTANVSHELKTPITAVMGYAEIMKNGLVPPEHVPEFSGRIHDEAVRLKHLVEDIIHLSKLDENRPQQFVPVDLRVQTESALKHLLQQAEAQNVSVCIEGSATVLGVPEQLQEMIGNLLDNAIKYNRGGGSVRVQMSEAADAAVLRIEDTGIGISPADQDRIFERFYRVDKSHSRQVDGTGLGLSIVKHVAANHHARLEVSSIPGEGSVFSITFAALSG